MKVIGIEHVGLSVVEMIQIKKDQMTRATQSSMEPYKPPDYYHNDKHKDEWEDPFLILLILVTLIFTYYVSRTLITCFL